MANTTEPRCCFSYYDNTKHILYVCAQPKHDRRSRHTRCDDRCLQGKRSHDEHLNCHRFSPGPAPAGAIPWEGGHHR